MQKLSKEAGTIEYEVINTFYVEQQPFIVAKLVINPGSRLEGLTVKQFCDNSRMSVTAFIAAQPAPKTATALSELRAKPLVYPEAELSLQGGDIIYFTGPFAHVKRLSA